MAKPIEPTPILAGEDAKKFIQITLAEDANPNLKNARFLHECFALYLKFKN